SDTANDRLLAISQADIMAAVEPVVAAHIERDIKPHLIAHQSEWGALPYPVPFDSGPGDATSRPQDSYVGDTSVPPAAGGLLPVTTAVNVWSSSGSLGKVSGLGDISGVSCAPSTAPAGY